MGTKLTHRTFLRLASPNKGPACCLGGAGHLVVPLFGEQGAHRAFFFFRALKLIFINLGGKNEIPLGVPPTPNKGTTTCPAPPKQHSGPLFGPASLRKMWRVSFVLMHASSGELWRGRQNFARSWILGRNGFLWSYKVKLYILGALGALSPVPANLARARHNRILLQVLVCMHTAVCSNS